ncbi:MAG: hypothetical protein ACK6DC_05380, partial [Planctomycetota bacterium]
RYNRQLAKRGDLPQLRSRYRYEHVVVMQESGGSREMRNGILGAGWIGIEATDVLKRLDRLLE